MAAEFGATAWARAWLRTIEKNAPKPKLSTARTLARANTVALTRLASGSIAADVTVKGTKFTVTIEVPLWTEKQFDSVTRALERAGAAGRSAPVGELPDSVVPALTSIGVGVAPELVDCTATCNCSAKLPPCVHHLAAIYALASKLDEEPAVALTLRSKPRKARAATATPETLSWIPLHEIDTSTFYER